MLNLAGNKINWLIFSFAFLLYANTIGHDYAWDDSVVITENPRVKKGIPGIPDLFVKYNSDYKADKYGYRPVVLIAFAIEYGLFKDKPAVSHFMNVIYFALLCCLLFKVLKKIFYRYKDSIAFIITLMFIAHPVHVEVVANIKSRDEIFALLFSLLSLNALINHYNTGQKKYLLYTVIFFMLAFLSKESSIVFLAIMPLTLLVLNEWKNWRRFALQGILFLGLMAVSFLIVRTYMNSTLGANDSKGAGIYYENGILGNSFFYTAVFTQKVANALLILMYYLKNFFWPVDLVYFYGYNQIPVATWSNPIVMVSLLLHGGLLGYALAVLKKQRFISYSIFFYFISISVYLHVFRTFADTMADRFLFTPSLALIMMVVLFVNKGFGLDLNTVSVAELFGKSKLAGRKNFSYAFVVVVLLLGWATFMRNKVWKNDETLIIHDMPKLKDCSRANFYYADILDKKLRKNFNPAMEADMISHYRRSFAISKESYYAYLGLAKYYSGSKKYNEAIGLLDTMLAIYPNTADPHYYIGDAYYKIDNPEKAVVHLKRSLELAPEVRGTYYALGLALSKKGAYEEALNTINTARSKFGESAYVYDVLGTIYFEKNDLEQSTKYTFEMLKYGETPQNVYGKIIGRYQLKKQDSLAAHYYQKALAEGVFRR